MDKSNITSVLSDKLLLHVADYIGSDYYSILIELGIRTVEVEQLEHDFKQIKRIVHKGLIKWRNSCRSGPIAAVEELFQCLRQNKRDDVICEIVTKGKELNLRLEETSLTSRLPLQGTQVINAMNCEKENRFARNIFSPSGMPSICDIQNKTITVRMLAKSDMLQTKKGDDMMMYLLQSNKGLVRAYSFGDMIPEINGKLTDRNLTFEIYNSYMKRENIGGINESFLTMNQYTTIRRADQVIDVLEPQMLKIAEVESIVVGTTNIRTISFEALIVDASERLYLERRATPLIRRKLTVFDGFSQISLILWGEEGRRFDKGSLIRVINGVICRFNDVYSVNAGFCTVIEELPFKEGLLQELLNNTPESELKEYEVESLRELLNPPTPCCVISLTASIHKIATNDMLYRTCPKGEHRKKIHFDENGYYFCRKCNKNYPEEDTKAQYRLRLLIKDNTGECWVKAFNSVSKKLLKEESETFATYSTNKQCKLIKSFLKKEQTLLFKIKVASVSSKYGGGLDYIVMNIE